jgi:hypothetical protein
VAPVGGGSGRRERLARAFVFGLALVAGGCASVTRSREIAIRPGVQQQPNLQVVGEAIVASLAGATVTVRCLNAAAVERYYADRPGLVYPWTREDWKQHSPTVFLVRVRNQTREEAQFDPGLVALVTQTGQRERPVPYEEMYVRLSGEEGSRPRLLSLQATLLSRFIVLAPGGQREGLLVFPALNPEAKHLLLEFSSFYVGGRNNPGLFEFQVLRQKTD